MHLSRWKIAVFLLLFTLSNWAAQSPVIFLENIANQLVNTLNKKKQPINKKEAYNIINQILLPHIDVQGMSRSVLGRTTWNLASKSERQQFSQTFTELVIQTYSKPFTKYSGETIQFYPLRGNWQSQTRIKVSSLIHRENAPSIPISYRLIRKNDRWKVYDFSVEGVSLVASYRSQFSSYLRSNHLRSLIKTLKKNNAK